MVIVALMAGQGARTKALDPHAPKQLIKIRGRYLLDWVISNFYFPEAKYVFVVQKQDSQTFHLDEVIRRYKVKYNLIEIDGPTEGAAISALAAASIFRGEELLILNTDQYLDIDVYKFIADARIKNVDGMIMTMFASGPKWSYVKVDTTGHVVEIAEKREISNLATVGAYWFKSGDLFESAALQMIEKNDRTNNEFYVAPTYNYLIHQSKNIFQFQIEPHGGRFYGLGTAADILTFENADASKVLVERIRHP